MKKTNKKGFTLVELLVVIAILAILATVSVVGYTAFIERATVSNDENVAAQLNQFLTAMKADSTGNFYNKELVVKNGDVIDIDKTVRNVRKAVKFAITDSGLNEEGRLAPDSAKYDYHFYYDTQENKIVVLSDNDAWGNNAPLAKLLVKAEDEVGKSNPATCFTVGGRYIFLDNAGSDLAEIVEELFNLESSTRLEEIKNNDKLGENSELRKFIDNNIIVDQTGKENYGGTKKAGGYFVTEPGASGKIDIDASQTNNGCYPDNINIPEHVSSVGGSYGDSNVNFEGDKTAEEIAGMIEENFTTGNITTDTNKQYKIENGTTEEGTTKVVKNQAENSDEQAEIKAKWGLFSFDIAVKDVANKIAKTGDITYVAWDYSGDIKFEAINVIEKKYVDPDDKSKGFTGEGRNSSRTLEQLTFESVSEILTGSNGTYKIANNSAKPTSDSVTVTASCSGQTTTATLNFVYLTGATVSVGDKSGTSFELENNDAEGGKSTFTVTLTTSQNIIISGITLDTSYTLTSSEKLAINGNQFTLADGVKDLYDATTVTAKVGGYYDKAFTVKVYSTSNLTFVKTATANQIKYIGTLNDITIGDLFDLNTTAGMTLPTNAVLWFGDDWNGTDTMPGKVDKPSTTPTQHKHIDSSTVTSINSSHWAANKLKFADGATTPEGASQNTVSCYIVIPTAKDDKGNETYRRISPVVTLKVVNAYNLKQGNISDFEFTTDTTTDYHKYGTFWVPVLGYIDAHVDLGCAQIPDQETSKSIVLLEDVVWPTDSKYYITFAENYGIYGNCFKFDVSGGRTNTISIINLGTKGWLRDAVIIGPQYEKEYDPWSKSGYACSKVKDTAGTVAIGGNNVKIDNCYISGGRAPVRIHGSDSVISNTVLFGGAFSNIDNQGVSFTLEDVTMINQYDATHNAHIGGGITISGAETSIKNAKIQIKGTFTQYNFVAENETGNLANTILGKEIGKIFDENRFVFGSDDVKYINAGIFYDKNKNENTDGNTYGDVDINVWVWNDAANDGKGGYVKQLPTGYGSKGIQYLTYKATIASFDNRKGSVDVADYRKQTEFYAPSLINTAEHYQVTWQTTNN